MGRSAAKSSTRFLIAAALGLLAGAVVGAALRETMAVRAQSRSAPEEQLLPPPVDSAGWQYAAAVQRGDWKAAAGMVLWMQDRLRRVQAQAGAAEAAGEQAALAAELSRREVAGNRLRAEGVEDEYILTPEASLGLVSRDGGRTDLERPAAERLWILVRYPTRERALRDASGAPVRALRVGVNISADGFVLKANVIGNLEIDAKSIRYDWD